MNTDSKQSRYATIYAVIPFTYRPAVLMIEEPGGWSLPQVQVPITTDSWWREVGTINEQLRQHFSIRLTALRCLTISEETNAISSVFLMENHSPGWGPHRGRGRDWVSYKEIAEAQLLMLEHRALISAWFDGDLPLSLLSWTRKGWFLEITDWLEKRLKEHDLQLLGRVEQVRSWFLSSILRARTTDGDVYLKATPPMYRYEPALTERLSRSYPTLLPEVLAVDNERGWLLMRAVEGVKLMHHPDREQYLPRWEGVLRDFARIQLDHIGQVDALLGMGLPDMRLENIVARIEPFFMQLPQLFEGSDQAPDAATLARYESWVPRLLEICAQLVEYGLPPTLHHGDLHSGNIITNDHECKLLDWAGGIGVAYPFCFFSTVFEEHTDLQVQDRVLRAYLEPWQSYASMESLLEAVRLAIAVGWVNGLFGHAAQVRLAADPWEIKQEQGNIAYCLRSLEQILG